MTDAPGSRRRTRRELRSSRFGESGIPIRRDAPMVQRSGFFPTPLWTWCDNSTRVGPQSGWNPGSDGQKFSFRENIDTGGPLGRAIVVIIAAIAELERNQIIERVRAGMRRARLEGRQTRRTPLVLDHAPIRRDRCQGAACEQSPRNTEFRRRPSSAFSKTSYHLRRRSIRILI